MNTRSATKFSAFLSLALALSPSLKADTFAFPSGDNPIRQVRLYDKGARVERPITLNLTAGRHTFMVSDLTGNLSTDTLQLTGLPASVRVLEVIPRLRIVKENPSPLIAQLEKEIRGLVHDIETLSDHTSSLQREESRLDSYQELARQAVSEQTLRAPYEQMALSSSIEFFSKRRRDLAAQIRLDEAGIKELSEKISQARKNLGELGPLSKQVTDVEILVEASSAFEGQGILAYVVNNASWTPVYEALNNNRGLRFNIGAHVHQNSGENWKDVQLTFSTSRPSLGALAPPLAGIHLDFINVNPERPVNVEMAQGERSITSAAHGLMLSREPLEAPSVEKTGINVVLISKGLSNVNSGTGSSRVSVLGYDFESSVEWVSIPSKNPRVFRRLTARNTAGHPLLAGPVHVFNEGRFLGFSNLKHRSDGESLDLSLGQDSLLKVRRKRDNDRCEPFKDGTFTSAKKGRVSWIIELKNEGAETRSVQVLEAIPVPELEGIKVGLTDQCTAPTSRTDDGILTWKVELKSGETREIRVEYAIEVPGNMEMALPQQ